MDDAIAETQVGLGMRNVIGHFEESFIDQPGTTITSLFRFGFSRACDEVQSAVHADSQEGTEQKESTSWEKYEQKRKMTGCRFRKKWLSKFIWLDYNEKERQMHFKVCRDFPNIADKNSRYHAKCVEAQKAKEVLKTKRLVN